MNPVIQAENLSRFYGIVMGLNNVSFSIGAGLTGLVGPNGAGKTTLIRLITGQIRPSAGRLLVLGESPGIAPGSRTHRLLCGRGCAPRQSLTHGLADRPGPDLRPGPGYGQDNGRNRSSIRWDWPRTVYGKSIAGFSKGMKQRVKLAQAFLHEPDLLVLDEPMNGLDPMGRREIADLLRDRAANGAHILISSHILPELESLCNQLVLMNWGRVLAAGNQSAIRSELQTWSER